MTPLGLVAVPAAVASASVAIPIGGALVRAGAVLDDARYAALPHVTATANGHDGTSATYEGVTLAAAVQDAGAPVGDAVRGSAARAYVLVSASDGYAALFSLGELSTAEARCAPFLAKTRDGAPLSAHDGPVQVIAPCDRTHARWVRGVTRLTVIVAQGQAGAEPSPGH